MSQVSVHVRAKDGKWYEDPVLFGRRNNTKKGRVLWFICFDDNDPPELVLFDNSEIPNLQDLGFELFGREFKPRPCGQRPVH